MIGLILSLWAGAGRVVGRALAWATASAARALLALLAASMALNLWQAHHVRAVRADLTAQVGHWRGLFAQEQVAYRSISAALAGQNAAIEAWQAQARAQQAVAATAIKRSTRHVAQVESEAAQLDQQAAQTTTATPTCHTPKIIMDRKDRL
jgi:hypothetical protein